MREIDLQPRDETGAALWASVGELTSILPSGWVLIGGLMVQLHAIEQGAHDVRATQDVDVLGQVRPRSTLLAIDQALTREGFVAAPPDPAGYAHRYERDGLVVDVLAPDGTRTAPSFGSGRSAIGVPGGSQALSRSEDVLVRLGERAFTVRRPTLLGAILIKARALLVHADPAAQREDLILLLSLLEDPRAAWTELKATERGWLRRAQPRLAFGDPTTIPADRVRRARLALTLLLRSPEGGAR